MLQFLCGLLLGGVVGIFVMALMAATRDEDPAEFGRDQ